MDNKDPNSLESRGQQIMTLSELAEYLRVAEKSVVRMVKRGDIPGAKVASQWRFVRDVIDDWLMSRMQSIPPSDLTRFLETAERVPLSRLTSPALIAPTLEPGSKQDVLTDEILSDVYQTRIRVNEIDGYYLAYPGQNAKT